VGGLIAARLHQYGTDVAVVARGAHLEAVQREGLQLDGPDGSFVARLEAVGTVSEARVAPTDVVLLAVKSQDSQAVLRELAAASNHAPAIVCAQNGLENERLALRLFPDVYGMCVMVPASHLSPGVVSVHCGPCSGVLDLGRWPTGTDDRAEAIAAELEHATFASRADPDIAAQKWAKLLGNINNSIEALCEDRSSAHELRELVRAEALAAAAAHGVDAAAGENLIVERHANITYSSPQGTTRWGGSSWQSLERGAGDIETDYLNGEIVLWARLAGLPAPANALLQRRATEAARLRRPPGSTTSTALLDELAAAR
jgi:2-dehydropantoate 2-reductase